MSATTGVYSANDIDWDWIGYGDYIDLEFETAVAEMCAEQGVGEGAEGYDDILFALEDFSGDTHLYGAWIKGEDGLYDAKRDDAFGDDPFALIYRSNENVMQVIWSKWIRYGRPASICYPNQVDARVDDPEQPDDICFMEYYALPPEAFYRPQKGL